MSPGVRKKNTLHVDILVFQCQTVAGLISFALVYRLITLAHFTL